MQHRKRGVLVGTALLTLAACGSSSDGAPTDSSPAPVVDEAPADTDADTDTDTDAVVEDDLTESDSTQDEPVAEEPAEAPAAETVTAETETPADTEPAPAEEAPAEPVATEAPVETAAEPVIGGRLFAADVQATADFDGNPFPDLVVDDIGKDAQVNIRNILPSDRPVLLWAWAPH